jgi:hypothetical protein
MLLVNFHTLDQCANDFAAREPIGFVQTCLDPRCKLVEASQDEREFALQAHFIGDLLRLVLTLLQTFSHTCNPGFKLVFVDQPLSITIK